MTHPASRKNNSKFSLVGRQGFTIFEFAIVAIIIAVVAGILVQRLYSYQARAEMAAVQNVLGSLRYALQMKAANLHAANNEAGIARLTDENPMKWLTQKPANYLGEFYAPDVKKFPHGNWYYDRTDKFVAYVLSNSENVHQKQAKLLKFKVILLRLPENPVKPSEAPETQMGVVLEETEG